MSHKFFRGKSVFLLVLMPLVSKMQAQTAPVTPDIRLSQQSVSLAIGNECTQVEFWNESVVRVVHRPVNGADIPQSLTVIAKPAKVDVKVSDQGDELVLSRARLQVHVEKATGRVRFL